MKFCNAICTETCIHLQCHCKLPLISMDHMQLPCCNESLCHVICISKKSECPNCKTKFNKQIKTYIKNVEFRILEKKKREEKRKQKQNLFRIQLQKQLHKIMCTIIKQNLKQNKHTK